MCGFLCFQKNSPDQINPLSSKNKLVKGKGKGKTKKGPKILVSKKMRKKRKLLLLKRNKLLISRRKINLRSRKSEKSSKNIQKSKFKSSDKVLVLVCVLGLAYVLGFEILFPFGLFSINIQNGILCEFMFTGIYEKQWC